MEPLSNEYALMSLDRTAFITAAENAAELTLPYVFPLEGLVRTEFPEPVDGFGTRGVNNLASKIMMVLFPSNQAGFQVTVDDNISEDIKAKAPEVWDMVEKEFTKSERKVLKVLEQLSIRSKAFEVIRLLIVTGNALVWLHDEELRASVHTLRDFVVSRDSSGKPLKIILRQKVKTSELPAGSYVTADGAAETTYIYTCCKYDRNKKKYRVWQEINDETVPSSQAYYDEDALPFIPIRWTSVPDSSYGLGLVGEEIGDFRSLEGLSKAILEFSAYMAWNPTLNNPAGQTDTEDLANAQNLDIISGLAQDVQPIVKASAGNIQPAYLMRQDIVQNLSAIFMLNSAIQRNAERVTAEEIRMMANELETALGGTYSFLVTEFQAPLLNWIFQYVSKTDNMINLKELKGARLQIVTGFEALSKASEFNRLMMFVQTLLNGPLANQILPYINALDFAQKASNYLGLVPSFLKTEEEVQQQQQNQMAQQAAIGGMEAGMMDGGNNGGQQSQ